MTGGQDGEIELDLDSLSRKALWALHDLYINSAAARHGPPRKGGGGRSGTPGPPRANSQAGVTTNQPEVTPLCMLSMLWHYNNKYHDMKKLLPLLGP